MARTIFVAKARKSPGSCLSPTCKHESRTIEAGESYKHFSMKLQYGGIKKSYHTDCEIPPSHRTTSRMGEIWDAQADAERSIPDTFEDDCSTLESIAQDFAQTVREVSEGYQESADNMESGFGHSTSMSEELADKAQQLESWADDLDSPDFDAFDEDDARESARVGTPTEGDEDPPEVEEAVESAKQDWWDEQVSKLQELLDNCPV